MFLIPWLRTLRSSATRRPRRARADRNTARSSAPRVEHLEDRTLLMTQAITPSVTNLQITPGNDVNFDVNYETVDPANASTGGITLRMHFDSSQLTFDQLTNRLNTSFLQQQVQNDTSDLDSDALTDMYVNTTWFDFSQNWPGVTLPASLYTANFTTDAGFTGSTTVNFSADPANGFDFSSQSVTISELVTVTPDVSISDAPTVAEGANSLFTVSLSADPTSTVTVSYQTAPTSGTATSGSDYTAITNGTLTFNPGGSLTQQISVTTIDDTEVEGDENFFVDLQSVTNGNITDGSGEGTITSDDLPSISISDAPAIDEGTDAVFTVSLDQSPLSDVTVTLSTTDGSAVSPDDFMAVNQQTLTFTPTGPLSQTYSVTTVDDTDAEGSENFTLNVVANSSNSAVGDGQGSATINPSDNTTPTISIADAPSVTEGGDAVFTVSLDVAPTSTLTVDYTTLDGTATNGSSASDFNSISGTLTFDPSGSLTQNVTVTTNDDSLVEPDENFFVSIGNPVNGVIGDGSGEAVILDNDVPTVSISDAPSVEEGLDAVFTVTLDQSPVTDLTVSYSTTNGTATAPDDFTAVTNQTLTFTPTSPLSAQITITTIDDPTDENDENFFVNLGNIQNGTINDGLGQGTILDNDTTGVMPLVSVENAGFVNEGDNAIFNVTLSESTSLTVTVTLSTTDGSATSPDDFTALSNQQLTFNPGTTTQQVTVQTIDDAAVENDETFTLDITSVVNGSPNGPFSSGGATIVDNDTNPLPQLSISDAGSVDEGLDAVFTVSLDTAPSSDVTVTLSTSDGSATSPGDFTAIASLSLTFTPTGSLSQNVSVTTIDDNLVEPTENFFLDIQSATGATIADPSGEGTILSADVPTISIADATGVTEGDNSIFSVTLDQEPLSALTVTYSTADGSAVAPGDYTAQSGQTLTFNPGTSLSQQITVSTVDDAIDETPDVENFFVNLAPGVGFVIGDGQGEGSIRDNDGTTDLASIHGRKWDDINGDGIRDPNEPWLNGWTIELVNPNGVVVDTQVTMDHDVDGDGQIDPETERGWYWFIDVIPGIEYLVREVQQPGWNQTFPDDGVATVTYELGTELGLFTTGNLFEDWGGLGEKWLLGNIGGRAQWYFITPNGDFFEWDDSPRFALTGDLVTTLPPQAHADTTLLTDPVRPNMHVLTLMPGEIVNDIDFGNQRIPEQGSIHGRKWHDLNRDGIRDPNEPYLNGWTIELFDNAGNVIDRQQTMDHDLDGDGNIDPDTERGWYWFENVVVGLHTVGEVIPEGWEQTFPYSEVAAEAFELDTKYRLRRAGFFYEDWGGRGERWLAGADNQWVFIDPDGTVYLWDGSGRDNLTGQVVGELTPEYYNDPSLLFDARNPEVHEVFVGPGETIDGVDFGNYLEDDIVIPPGHPCEDVPGAGVVSIDLNGENAVIQGDEQDNAIFVFLNQDGWITIEGLGDTMLLVSQNGEQIQDSLFVAEGIMQLPGSVNINLGGGNDTICADGIGIDGNADINLGDGDNTLIADGLYVGGNLNVNANGGSNIIGLRDSHIGGNSAFNTNGGADILLTDDTEFDGAVVADLGLQNDWVLHRDTIFNGDAAFSLGAGNDLHAFISGNQARGRMVSQGGSGVNGLYGDDRPGTTNMFTSNDIQGYSQVNANDDGLVAQWLDQIDQQFQQRNIFGALDEGM